MATTNTQAAARPARTRSTAPKAATPKAAEATAEAPVAAEAAAPAETAIPDTSTKLVLVHEKTTRRYEVFQPDAASQAAGIVGSLYFPLGTKSVKVLATK